MVDPRRLIQSYPFAFVLTAAAYAATAALGLQRPVLPGAGTAIWPAAGVAFAALSIGGLRLWLAVDVGRLVTALIVASPAPLLHCGFSSRLIERGLAAEFEGDVTIDYLLGGQRCDVRAPLDRLAA